MSKKEELQQAVKEEVTDKLVMTWEGQVEKVKKVHSYDLNESFQTHADTLHSFIRLFKAASTSVNGAAELDGHLYPVLDEIETRLIHIKTIHEELYVRLVEVKKENAA